MTSSSPSCLTLALFAAAYVIALSLGVGLGLGLSNKSSPPRATPSIAPVTASATASSTGTSTSTASATASAIAPVPSPRSGSRLPSEAALALARQPRPTIPAGTVIDKIYEKGFGFKTAVAPADTAACCSWNSCGACGTEVSDGSSNDNTWCWGSEGQCESDCGGTWCPTGPVPVADIPQDQTQPCCSWNACGECPPSSPYCVGTESADTCSSCSGTWCPNGALAPYGNVASVCDSNSVGADEVAYACLDWSVGSQAMLAAAVSDGNDESYFYGVGSYGTTSSNLGKCFALTIEGAAKKGLFQVVNTGDDVATFQFDVQTGDGGVGLFNGCVAPVVSQSPGMFAGFINWTAQPAGFYDPTWGKQYGGVNDVSGCANLPPVPQVDSSARPSGETLVTLCEAGFQLGVRLASGGNPTITSATRVPCPAALVAITNLARTDDAVAESYGSGTLTRMLDCCKPSAGWTDNIPLADPSHPAIKPCTADGYTRVTG